jgi:beta-xylosidase
MQISYRNIYMIITMVSIAFIANAQQPYISKVWVADKGNGTYQNPIIHADYSDPDVIRVGTDFYMTASSFNCAPGLPILHSKDLVNWTIVAYAFQQQPPYNIFKNVQHGGGVWAPAIRYHNNEFYIYYPDPDRGIYMTKARNITGPWTAPLLMKEVKGWIDPCPFWDEDGNAYLVNALAASRIGMKSVLYMHRMNKEGDKILDDGVLVYDGHKDDPTIEGPKLYKRNGYYYILAPAGGVGTGWEVALRSKNIFGPYERKIVLEQGKASNTNGPHQGGWVTTTTGEDWFIHFQDKDAYGRIIHLQPMQWKNNWPIIGIDRDGNGIGEPVDRYKKPNVGKTYPIQTPQESDEFNAPALGLQWQWHTNPQATWGTASSLGFLRLQNIPLPDSMKSYWDVNNLLAQKFPAPDFTATAKFTFTSKTKDEETGIIITGYDYARIFVKRTAQGFVVGEAICKNAVNGAAEKVITETSMPSTTFYLRVKVENVLPESNVYQSVNNKGNNSAYGNALCAFYYSTDGSNFSKLGDTFLASKGKWIGSKVGLFATRKGTAYETGYVDVDWFRIEK